MNTAPAPAEAAKADAALAGGWARPMLDRQLQVLGELAEIGLDLARAVEAEAKGPEPDLDKAVLAYARVSRAVRQTIMLQSRLIEALKAAEAGEAAKNKEIHSRRAGVRDALGPVVRRAIEAEHEAPEHIERLAAEAAERLEHEAYGDLLGRPIRDIVADICRDLGLDPDWAYLEPWIIEAEARADESLRDGEPDWSGPIEVVWLPPEPPPRRSSA